MRIPWVLFLTLPLFAAACVAPEAVTTTTVTAAPPPTATRTPAPTATPSIVPTFTASPVPTPTWVVQGPDEVTVPILLYHRIDVSPINSRYYVPPDKFRDQIRLLHDWGYQSISSEMLIRAIREGIELPPRPVLITFDDGHLDNYTSAFPIMQEYGFTGILYIVANYLGADGYLDAEQIRSMHEAGWEVGSHSLNHRDLPALEPGLQRDEVVVSRERLEQELGVPVLTFAYPFGSFTAGVVDYVHFAGYRAAMAATGYTADQGLSNLYALQRIEIKGQEDARSFTRFLPWKGDPAFLPTGMPTATLIPSRTPIPTYTQYPALTPTP
jgi:peptidoglycan/xylan/chitin deacetylase (PgdA/CDA1 family)